MLKRRRLKEETKRSYLKAIRCFSQHLGLKPYEVVEKIKGMDDQSIIELFRDWFIWLRDNTAPKTTSNWFGGVKVWLEENDIDIDAYSKKLRKEFKKYVGRVEKLLKRDIITKEEIIKILHNADLREGFVYFTCFFWLKGW
jgi:hypothetical protein